MKEKILSQGNELGGGTPEDFVALVKAEGAALEQGGQGREDDRGLTWRAARPVQPEGFARTGAHVLQRRFYFTVSTSAVNT